MQARTDSKTAAVHWPTIGDFLGPLKAELLDQFDAIVTQAVLLKRIAGRSPRLEAVRPDVEQLVEAAEVLLSSAKEEFSRCTTDAGQESFAADTQRARHDVGNALHRVLGLSQFIELDADRRAKSFFTALARLRRYCESAAVQLSHFGKPPRKADEAAGPVFPAPDDGKVAAEPLKILLVDDNAASADLAAKYLRRHGHTVDIAEDGVVALDRLHKTLFDLILLDVLLPKLSGIDVLKRLKGNERLRHIPVIMVSGLDDTTSIARSIELGAEDYLHKPVDLTLLLARIKSCQARKQLRELELRQFFTRDLSAVLACEPEKLQGHRATVTVLFCDIRRFSAISERLESSETVRWISDSMAVFSECVFENHGVLIDYIGDELMAMWGAPIARDDHADLACSAALDMIDRLKELNERWRDILGEPMRIGIGMNSGEAHVGVTGSRQRFKYGPLGPNVNIASRVQGASKYLKTSLLVTQRTLDCSQDRSRFAVRRLCTAKVMNIEEQIPLFELQRPSSEASDLFGWYETSLELFESGRLSEAARILGGLLATQQDDGPSQLLMSRVLAALVSGGSYDPLWVPPGK